MSRAAGLVGAATLYTFGVLLCVLGFLTAPVGVALFGFAMLDASGKMMTLGHIALCAGLVFGPWLLGGALIIIGMVLRLGATAGSE